MQYTPGALLKLTSPSIWQGQDLTNGKLMKGMGIPHLTFGYARLVLSTALTLTGVDGVPFGAGVFFDRNRKATEPNVVYGGRSTTAGAVHKLAGVMIQDEGIMTGHPADNNVVRPEQKGKIAKRGIVQYKQALNAAGSATLGYADVNDATMQMYVANDTGLPVVGVGTVTAGNLKPVLANCTFIGNIISLDPENKAWWVELDIE